MHTHTHTRTGRALHPRQSLHRHEYGATRQCVQITEFCDYARANLNVARIIWRATSIWPSSVVRMVGLFSLFKRFQRL